MISGGLEFGDGKTRIEIRLNVIVKFHKIMIRYRGNRYMSAFPKAPPAGIE